jgi:carboxypeptidase C (cathepsin A)
LDEYFAAAPNPRENRKKIARGITYAHFRRVTFMRLGGAQVHMRAVTMIGWSALLGASAMAGAAAAPARIPQSAVTHHVIRLGDKSVPYTATVAETLVDDQSGAAGAAVITIAYTRDDVHRAQSRPVMFAFNGGPGASSSPLHMSALGPMGRSHSPGKAGGSSSLSENPDCPLDAMDLVFIDPVSTGFSRAFPGVDPKQWYSGAADAIEVAAVIKNWLKVHRREASPRYLTGESYGATRAGLILKYAPELKWNGVLLISGGGRAGPNSREISVIGPMAAGAWFHNKIDRNGRSVEEIFAEANRFARGPYADALAQGDALPAAQAHAIAEKLSSLIGLPAGLIEENRLRVSDNLYMFNLLKDRGLRTGLLDIRVTDTLVENAAGGIDDPALGVVKPQANGAVPTPESVGAVVSPTVGRYISGDLKFQTTEPYYGVNFKANIAWDYHAPDKSQEETTAAILSRVMARDSKLRLFTVSGYFDLNASDGSGFVEAGVPTDRYTQMMLPGPHEVYEGEENHKAFNDAVRRFVAGR